MKQYLCILVLSVSGLMGDGCRQKKADQPNSGDVSAIVHQMTQLMVHDITNPPLATRFYAYAMLAGLTIVASQDSTVLNPADYLSNFPQLPALNTKAISVPLTTQLAILETAARMQPSGTQLIDYQHQLLKKSGDEGIPDDVLTNSCAQAQMVAKAIIAYARQDGYARISDYPRYTPIRDDGHWYPTPPAFMTAVEPHFSKVKPFIVRAADQFRPQLPTPFDSHPGSAFDQLMRDVYTTGAHLTTSQRTIAAFWDCNPFAVQDAGHLQIGLKKMSPGSHWMGITGIVCKQRNVSFAKTVEIFTVLSMTMMDAFICCWDEKYRSNRTRPETVIRRYVDAEYRPFLQTPPFPEYLSGHSVISSAAGEVLTHYLGASVAYRDTVEVAYGLPPRQFSSFRQAAVEAGLSRFYGGIHFRDAIDNGQQQGKQVGQWVIGRLTRHDRKLVVAQRP